ncbi:MAG: AEC family transporter [Verrucomicrobia bacterium]|nr:AEC family transporter [Verrucomicrobiota bacterium]
MEGFWIITQASIPVFLMMGVGYLLCALKQFPKETFNAILNIDVKALIPCLIVDSILGNQALKNFGTLLSAPVFGIFMLLLGLGAGLITRRVAGLSKEEAPQWRSYAVTVGLFNYGYIPFPLALALYDQETVGVLFVFNVGIEICVWTIIAALLSGYSLLKEWKKIFNMPLLAIIFSLILNFAGVPLPGVLRQTCHALGQCAYPLGLVVCGGVIYYLCREESLLDRLRAPLTTTALRCGLLPILTLLAAMFFPFSVELKRVIILQAAMPTAVFAMVLSQMFHADSALAFRGVLLSTLLSIITTPIWIHIGTKMLM